MRIALNSKNGVLFTFQSIPVSLQSNLSLSIIVHGKQTWTQCIMKLWTTSLFTYYCAFIINVFLSQFNCIFDTLKSIKIKLEKFNNKPQSNLSECGSSKAMRWHNAYRMSWNEVTWLWGRWSIRRLMCFRFSGWIPRAAGLDDWQYLILEEFFIYIGAQCFWINIVIRSFCVFPYYLPKCFFNSLTTTVSSGYSFHLCTFIKKAFY